MASGGSRDQVAVKGAAAAMAGKKQLADWSGQAPRTDQTITKRWWMVFTPLFSLFFIDFLFSFFIPLPLSFSFIFCFVCAAFQPFPSLRTQPPRQNGRPATRPLRVITIGGEGLRVNDAASALTPIYERTPRPRCYCRVYERTLPQIPARRLKRLFFKKMINSRLIRFTWWSSRHHIFYKKIISPSGDLNAKAKLGICLRDSPVCVCVCVCFWSVYVWKTWWRCWSCSRHTSPALSIIERSISKTATGLSLFDSSGPLPPLFNI